MGRPSWVSMSWNRHQSPCLASSAPYQLLCPLEATVLHTERGSRKDKSKQTPPQTEAIRPLFRFSQA